MSSFKFSCSGCAQHIECDDSLCGKRIQCPACNASLLVPLRPAAPAPAAIPCPGCGRMLRPGAVLCQICGFNIESGQVHESLRPAENSASDDTPRPRNRLSRITKTILTLVTLLFLLLYGLTYINPIGFVIYLGTFTLASFLLQIMVLITAFRHTALQGLLCLLLPFYSLYFVYARSHSPTLKSGTTLLIILALLGASLVLALPPPDPVP